MLVDVPNSITGKVAMIGLAAAALVLSLLEIAGVVLGVIAFVKVMRLQKELDTLREKLRAKFRQTEQPETDKPPNASAAI